MEPNGLLEKLTKPPIFEVVCGVFFSALGGLDPIIVGTYWDARRDDFPERALQPAVGPQTVLLGPGVPPLRTWLISKNDGPFVLQIQADRFYLNWRKRGESYPRFSTTDGLLALALKEFTRFSDFCEANLGGRPRPQAIELAKVDDFVEGRDWTGKDDLAQMLPSLAPLLSVTATDAPDVLMRFRESRAGHSLQVALSSMDVEHGGTRHRVVRLETTVVRPAGPEMEEVRAAFERANGDANAVFGALVPRDQRRRRFQPEG